MGLFTGGARERREGPLAVDGIPLVPPRTNGVRTTAGVMVTSESALTLSALWRCVTLRADMVSTLPLNAYRQVGTDAVSIPKLGLLRSPGGDKMTLEEWLYVTQVSLDLRGNAFGIYTTVDGLGYPTSIELQHPDAVAVMLDRNTGRVRYAVNGKEIAPEMMYHERQFMAPGSVLGLSPISYHARTLGIGLASEKFGADWFADGAHPSAVLSSDRAVTESDAKTIKSRFVEAIRGTREPVVLGLGIKYSAIQVAPSESQFIETMRYSAVQVARIYGVRPERLGESSGGSMTYANVEQANIDDLTYGFGPTLIRRERNFSRLLPGNAFVKYDLKALLRADAETRFKTHAIGIAAKFETPDEARAEEGQPPLTDEQKAVLELVPLTTTPSGTPKALPNPGTPATEGNTTP